MTKPLPTDPVERARRQRKRALDRMYRSKSYWSRRAYQQAQEKAHRDAIDRLGHVTEEQLEARLRELEAARLHLAKVREAALHAGPGTPQRDAIKCIARALRNVHRCEVALGLTPRGSVAS